jgi:L-amino acid N-acyltransferase
MKGLIIRPATARDLPAIHAIYNDAILTTTATWDEEPWPFAARETWWAEHEADPSCPVLAAERNGETIGFAYLSWYRPKSGYRFTRENTVYIAPEHQGTGVGRALMEVLLERARALDLHVIVAGIEANNAASIGLHTALGYTVAGTTREVGFKFGRWLDLVTMELMLPGRAKP